MVSASKLENAVWKAIRQALMNPKNTHKPRIPSIAKRLGKHEKFEREARRVSKGEGNSKSEKGQADRDIFRWHHNETATAI